MNKSQETVIEEIYVMPYVLRNDPYIDREKWYICGVLISANQESLEEYLEKFRKRNHECLIDLKNIIEMEESEARERYGDDLISKILFPDGSVDHNYGYPLRVRDNGDDYIYEETYMSIERLREKRKINSQPFDADDLISKISSKYVITPERKKALLKSINKLL